MTENAMQVWGGGGQLPAQAGTDKELERLAGSSYLPRIDLMDKNSNYVTEDKIKAGKFAFIKAKDQFEDLTNSFEMLVLARRPKALRMKPALLAVYDPKSEEFQKIEAQSELKDSGCKFGTEYLVWHRASQRFATFFCGSKTSRRASADLNTILTSWKKGERPIPAVLVTSTLITGTGSNTYKWWGPVFSPCTTPFSVMPDMEDVNDQVRKFVNPPKSETETVDEPVQSRG